MVKIFNATLCIVKILGTTTVVAETHASIVVKPIGKGLKNPLPLSIIISTLTVAALQPKRQQLYLQ